MFGCAYFEDEKFAHDSRAADTAAGTDTMRVAAAGVTAATAAVTVAEDMVVGDMFEICFVPSETL